MALIQPNWMYKRNFMAGISKLALIAADDFSVDKKHFGRQKYGYN